MINAATGRRELLLALLPALVLVLISPQPVTYAAFPGGNGKIVFASNRDGDNEIFVMNADGSGLAQITTNHVDDTAPRWSPNGERILFSGDRGGANVLVMTADGSGQTQLTAGPGSSGSPAWSPDMSKVVFYSDRDGNQEIYVMNADGSGVTRLTNDAGTDNEPAWSPDGSKILFHSDRDGDFEIFVMNSDGSAQTQLTFNVAIHDVQPDWSPDGAKIAFARGEVGTLELEIWVMSANGSAQTRLTNNPAIDNQPSFSPDGTKIAFSSDRDGDTDVFVMDANGQGQTSLTMSLGNGYLPDWQPVRPTGLISKWQAEGDASDSVGGNDGTLQNGASFATGKVGQAFSFDGVDDEVEVFPPHDPSLNPANGITVDAWVLTTSFDGPPAFTGHGRPIAQYRSSSNIGGYTFETTDIPYGPDNGLQWVVWIEEEGHPLGPRFLQTPPHVLQAGVWQHVAATFDGRNLRIFVDGVQVAHRCANDDEPTTGCPTAFSVAPVITSAPRFVIGRNVVAGFIWNGSIDEVEVYNRALSAAEIRGIANNNLPPPAPIVTQTTLSSSPNPSTPGEQVTLTATITPASATGSVSFYDETAEIELGIASVSNGVATLMVAFEAGVRSMRALYTGDPAHAASSAVVVQTVQSGLQNSSTALTTSANPSAFGQALTLTATVTPATATGRVTFYDGTALLGTRTLTGGQAVFATTLLPSGARSLTARYGGDGATNPSTSAALSQLVQAAPKDTLLPPVHYGSGLSSSAVAVADFNLDGRADLMTTNFANDTVTLLVGTGAGSFSPILSYPAGNGPCDIAVGDFNGDSLSDLAVVNQLSSAVSVVRGIPGSFLAPVSYNVGGGACSVAIGDFNRDGHGDLVVGNFDFNNVSVLLGNGDATATFQAAAFYAAGEGPTDVAVSDFNGDGRPDLAVTNGGSSSVSILLGNGDGSFQAAVPFAVAGVPVSVAAADLNGDGRADLAVASIGTNNVNILLGNGTGGFSAAVQYPTGGIDPKVAVGDVNGDGRADLITANGGTDNVSVLIGNGNGTFQPAAHYAAGNNPSSVVVSDFNYDGGTDLAIANQSSDGVSILIGAVGTTTTLVSPQNPSVLSQAVTLTASVTPAIATGLVTFFDGQVILGTRPLVNGQAVFTTTLLPSGVRSLTALFGGDAFHGLSISPVLSQTVAAAAQDSFHPAVSYRTSHSVRSVVVGDFNGDGRADLAAGSETNAVDVLLGNGEGSFLRRPSYGIYNRARALAVGDFNSDGHTDVAVAGQPVGGADGLTVMLGNGTGDLQDYRTAVTYPVGTDPVSLAVGDFNSDGRADLVVANNGTGTVSVLLGNGNGTFQPRIDYAAGTSPMAVGVADFNRDQIADLAVGHSGGVSLLLGNGNGSFRPAQLTPGVGQTGAIGVADFNQDGNPDLVTAGSFDGVRLLIGIGNGTFSSALAYPTGTGSTALAIGDINGDGALDVATAYPASFNNAGRLSVLYGAVGSFLPAVQQAVQHVGVSHPFALALGDFDGDGGTDIVVGQEEDEYVNVLLGRNTIATSTTLVVSSTASTLSQPVTLTATVTPMMAAGTVTFFDGMAILGTSPLVNSQATMTTTLLPAGVRGLRAFYGGVKAGDPIHRPSTSSVIPHLVTAAPQDSYHPAVPYRTNDNVLSVVVGDFNGDGRADVAAGGGSNAVDVLLGNGDGSFLLRPRFIYNRARALAVGDFNGDGHTDLAVAGQPVGGADGLTVMLGDGTGDLQDYLTAVTYPVGTDPVSLAVGDFNGDGRADLVVANNAAGTVSVLLGNGNGTFQPRIDYAAGTSPMAVGVADFNRDQIADLAVGHSGGVSLLLGNGNGSFRPAQLTPGVDQTGAIGVADFNQDGNPDLVTAGGFDSVRLLIGIGNGTFAPTQSYPTGHFRSAAVTIGDINGDGLLDVATANPGSLSTPGNVSVLHGAFGGFLPAVLYSAGDAPAALAVGDFNGDGGSDLVVGSERTENVNILSVATTSVTVNTSPPGLRITVDGLPREPQTFNWFTGTTHVIAVTSPQPSGPGTVLRFINWSDGGAQSHSITATSVPATYTANFTTQYSLEAAVLPAGGGTIAAVPPSPDGYYDAATPVQLTGVPAAGFGFTHFAGSLTGSANPQTITMNGPRSVVANFAPLPTSIAGTILSKSGLTNTRRWTIRLTNNGPGIALNTRITGFILLQTFGPACTPNVISPSAFPFAVGDIAPGASANAVITIDFRGCLSTNRYVVAIPFSANSGAVTGIIVRFNQFQ